MCHSASPWAAGHIACLAAGRLEGFSERQAARLPCGAPILRIPQRAAAEVAAGGEVGGDPAVLPVACGEIDRLRSRQLPGNGGGQCGKLPCSPRIARACQEG